MRILLYTLTFLVSCAAAAFLYGRYLPVAPDVEPVTPVSPVVTELPQYREGPPDEALKGNILELEGTAMHFPRTGDMPIPASQGAILVQGDSLAASPSSSVTALFPGSMQIVIGSESSVTFADLLPSSLLLWLRRGSAVFSSLIPGQPLGIRVLDGLLILAGGSAEVTVESDSSGAEILVSSGSATLTQVDAGNETRTIVIPAGSGAFLDTVADVMILR